MAGAVSSFSKNGPDWNSAILVLMLASAPLISLYLGNPLSIDRTEFLEFLAMHLGIAAIAALLVFAIRWRPLKWLILAIFLALFLASHHADVARSIHGIDLARARIVYAALAAVVATATVLSSRFKTAMIYGLVVYLAVPAVGAISDLSAQRPTDTGNGPKTVLKQRPDIFHVLVDGYANVKVLQNYGYSNSSFIRDLAKRGFWTPTETFSNYPRTLISLPSILNSKYYGDGPERQPQQPGDLAHDLRDSVVQNEFLAQGYDVTRHYSIWQNSACGDVKTITCIDTEGLWLSEFVAAYLRKFPFEWSTIVKVQRAAARRLSTMTRSNPVDALADDLARPHGDRSRYDFAHLVLPHPPFRFDARCAPISPPDSITGWDPPQLYLDQTTCLNTLLIKLIDEIAAVDPEAVIILQSDHGPGFKSSAYDNSDAAPDPATLDERMRNFIAVKWPTGCTAPDEPFTNVNLYPVLLGCLTGTEPKRLPDRFFWMTGKEDVFEVSPPPSYVPRPASD